MKKNLLNKKGFTIIEVLIVLAIAGLILLIVFMAVPALQRNSRNTQRNNDAASLGGAVNECVSAKNGLISACDSVAEMQGVGLDTNKLGQLTTVTVAASSPAMPAAGQMNNASIGFASKCNASGDAVVAAGNRSAVVLYRLESTGGDIPRCIEV